MIIVIDGPSGTGKTTVARKCADKMSFVYFDTGALYRAFTWYVLEHNIDLHEISSIQTLLNQFVFNIVDKNAKKYYFVGDHDVTDVIRSQPVTAHVSAASALKEVRDHLLHIQHQFAVGKNAVFEGRDLGTVVFPQAEVKVFLTADPRVRAERRLKETLEKKIEGMQHLTREQMLFDIERRDAFDSTREIAPLCCPVNALEIDTTNLSIDEVVDKIVVYAQQHQLTLKSTMLKLKPAWARNIPMSWLYRSVLCVAWSFFKLFYRHRVYGLEHFYQDAAIIAANHSSYYDPPILAISWPEEVHFLAREGLFKNPFFGSLIRKLNSHPVSGDASDIGVFKLVCSLLKEGKKIILFPEGKRGETDTLGTLKPGIAMLISRSKSAAIPAYIHGSFAIWNKGKKLPKLWGKTACVFGTPILWSQFDHLEKKEAQRAFTKRLEQSILALRYWYENGAIGTPP